MKRLIDLAMRPVSTLRQDASFAELASYGGAVLLLPLGLRAALRLTETNGELLIAVLATSILSVQLVVLGALARVYCKHFGKDATA